MKRIVFDCEVYPNFFLASFKDIDSEKVVPIFTKEESSLSSKDKQRIVKIMRENLLVGFNSSKFDIPILFAAISGYTTQEISVLSNSIINSEKPGWLTVKENNLDTFPITHCDLIEVAPGVAVSLKLYGARLNCHNLQDLPIEPNQLLTEDEKQQIIDYCENDLITTEALFRAIEPQIDLRKKLSIDYAIDLLSKSDAQIAETVILKKIDKNVAKVSLRKDYSCYYRPPRYIHFKTPELKELVEKIKTVEFSLSENGSVKLPTFLSLKKIKIGKMVYKIGIGGLHSTEKNQYYVEDNEYVLIDKDVTSYYPSIIINDRLYPSHIGPVFLNVYEEIVKERVKAKRTGDKVKNESLKIVINSAFGKLGSKYSKLYAPDLMLQVTLTGQLALLMLIERLELMGINVISANTDGFVSYVPKERLSEYENKCSQWEKLTGFNLEATNYQGLFSRDVNNYFAITNGKIKTKGIFAETGLRKNNQASVIVKSVLSHFVNGTNIEEYIEKEDDIKEFLMSRSVTGGAVWKDRYLGRVVRWYFSKDGENIFYKKNGNRVPDTDNAIPLMTLQQVNDVDKSKYIQKAYEIKDSLKIGIL